MGEVTITDILAIIISSIALLITIINQIIIPPCPGIKLLKSLIL